MASELTKTVITYIVTNRTRFNFKKDKKPFIYKCISTDNYNSYYSVISISIDRISAIEYEQHHIYIHCVGYGCYIDIDFNLISNKTQLSLSIFRQLNKLMPISTREYAIHNKMKGDPFTHKILVYRKDETYPYRRYDLSGSASNNDADDACKIDIDF